jgi:hypothetical protein
VTAQSASDSRVPGTLRLAHSPWKWGKIGGAREAHPLLLVLTMRSVVASRAASLVLVISAIGVAVACGGTTTSSGGQHLDDPDAGGSGAGGGTATGGAFATGGTTASGGAIATGGTTAAGGSVASGGYPAGGAPGTGGSGGATTCAASKFSPPSNHRATADACPPQMLPSCDAGVFNQPCGKGCTTNADCASDATCACAGTVRAWAGVSEGNVCIPSNCRTDADCGSGYCSPTVSSDCGSFYGTAGFYCHTCDDTCENDSDCAAQTTNSPSGYCAYDSTVGHWACGYSFCAG